MQEMPFDDPLIDIDVKDIVDMVRVYSAYSSSNLSAESLFVPKLFSDDSSDNI